MDLDSAAPLETTDANTENVGVAGLPSGGTEQTDDNLEEIRGKHGYKQTKDGNKILASNGRSYVREEALNEERRRASKYAETIAQLEPHMKEFEEFLNEKSKPKETTRDESEFSKDDLEAYAVAMGWYDRYNNPDTKRADSALSIQSKVSKRNAQEAVRPLSDQTQKERAQQYHQTARNGKFLDNEPFADGRYIDAAFQSLPEQYRADPEIAQAATLIAAGLEYLDLRKQGKLGRGRRGEPNFRESSGGRFTSVDEGLDDLDRQAARSRGKSDGDWAKMSKGGRQDATGGWILEDV